MIEIIRIRRSSRTIEALEDGRWREHHPEEHWWHEERHDRQFRAEIARELLRRIWDPEYGYRRRNRNFGRQPRRSWDRSSVREAA